ncbi:MAG: glutamate formimidoyltransferase [Anaerolineae bacterium]|nr:glutamate formimidoyltransferase [Anaerolineae bacterium]
MSKRIYMPPLIECVPNFSEGRDMAVVRQITDAIEAVDGVQLLDVDPGASTNRTVVTFVGEPEVVVEAAYAAIRAASAVIDMRTHHGEHPRMGATDVCPLVPVAGITMEEVVAHARRLAQRVGEELGIPVYLYEAAATRPERKNLATIRAGEYEGLRDKLKHPDWQPDFGPATFNPRSGATVIGARDFLIAYNINLNTTSTRRANAVAFDLRERGRVKREGGSLLGEVIRDESGEPVRIPGVLEGVKAIGWYIEEYGICQVSMNLTDLAATPLHEAFEAACDRAAARGLRVTGSELVGMVPLHVLREAGEYYLRKQQRSLGIPTSEIIKIAVRSLGLSELAPFKPQERVIELAMAARTPRAPQLVDKTVTGFVDAVASEAPTPGGGSVAATVGALGAALGTMVANGSAHKRGWDARWETFSDWAVRGREVLEELLALVDEDSRAFDALMAAYGLPKETPEERTEREAAIQQATRGAIDVPLRTMRAALQAMDVVKAMAEIGNPNAISDAGVGALCARAAVRGAGFNVRINAGGLTDREAATQLVAEAREIDARAAVLEKEILALVDASMDGGCG